MSFISNWLSKGTSNFSWLIQTMDVTQWGIVACVIVFLGFLALKTKI